MVNTGHCHPRIIAAVQEQMERFTHTCFQVVMYESYIALAERLNALVPISGAVKSAFFTTGAEATENAIKIARAATGRSGVIAFTGGFHGRTILASALTGKVVPYKKGLCPALPDVWHVPFPTGQNDVTVEDALKYLDFIFKADVDPSRVAAIIIEPVQGEGGFHQAPQELLRALRRICDEHGIVLIADEVQTGFGRTGTMFAMEHYDVEPDLICVAKSLAGGFPLSGVIGRAPIMDAAEPGGLGGTYAGNPLACVAALAVLDVFEEERLLERSQAIGAPAHAAGAAGGTERLVADCRCARPGGQVAFDIVKDREWRARCCGCQAVVQRAYESGLILLSCGTSANTIRILVPLTAEDAIVDEGLEILEQALAA